MWPSNVPISFARAGATASRFNGAGVLLTGIAADTPRLDFDPVSKAARGFLIEGAFTNLLTRSEELDHSDWTKTNGVPTANDRAAPDGAASMDLFTATATLGTGAYVQQNKAAVVASGFALSFFVRKRDTDWAAIEVTDGANNGRRFWFNIATGVIGSTAAVASGVTMLGYRIMDCGGGIYRCHAVFTAADTTAKCLFHPVCDADGSVGVTAGRGNHAWGLMAGVGEDCGSYVKTTSGTATRAADTVSIPAAGLLRPAGFTIFSEFMVPQIWQGAHRHGAFVHDGSSSNAARSGWSGGGANLADGVISGGVAIYQDVGPLALSALSVFKHAMRVEADNFIGCWNGTLNDPDMAGAMPSNLALVQLGGRNSQIEPLNGWLRRVRLFPRPLSNAQLQAITAP